MLHRLNIKASCFEDLMFAVKIVLIERVIGNLKCTIDQSLVILTNLITYYCFSTKHDSKLSFIHFSTPVFFWNDGISKHTISYVGV